MSKLIGLLSKINPQKVFENISKGVDNLAFTQQERAELNMKLADKVAEYAEKTLSENTIRSKARRIIAYVIVFTWITAALLDIWIDNADLTYLWQDSVLKTAFIMVLAFFFGGYYLKGGISPTRIKKS